MTQPTSDTLDLNSIYPGSSNREIEAIGERDPEAAAAARNLIASLGETPVVDHPAHSATDLPLAAATPAAPLAAPSAPQAQSSAPVLQTAVASPAVDQPATPAKRKLGSRELPSPVRPIASAIGSFLLLLVLFKSQIIFSQVRYLLGAKPATTQSANATLASAQAAVSAAPTISIPKINVNAPVVYEQSIAENDILTALQNGIVHYGTTPAPGQGGNAVFVGHSSNDWWEPGNYKFVFVLLDKLVVGDKFSLNYQSRQYVYQVTGVSVVAPTDVGVLAPTTQPSVTLITCTPPGTSWKRLVVTANQISPNPATTTTVDTTTSSDKPIELPGNAPTITSQLAKGWDNITRSISDLFGGHKSTGSPAPVTPQSSAPATTPSSVDTLPLAK